MPEPFPSAKVPRLGGKVRLECIPPAVYSSMPKLQAKVKSVLSGDSLILTSATGSERILSLAFVTAPHLRKEGDEQYAFESRDFLRRLAVGKVIMFEVLYQIPNTKREYGLVYLQDGTQLPDEAVKNGWLKLRDDAGRKEDTEQAVQQLDKLRLFEAQARSEDKGLWAKVTAPITVQHDMGNAADFLERWKGETVDGIVERVLSGDRMLLRLMLSPTHHVQTMTLVGGIRAPTTERVNPSNQQVQPAEPHGDEARKFVEDRLLQRNVKVGIFGLSPQNQLIASLIHPNGSIADFLLRAGLARCYDSHSTLLGRNMDALRTAEKQAQAAKVGLWEGHVAKSTGAGGNLDATVTKVFSSDIIYVRTKTGVEKRINITSLRGPRTGEPSEAPFRDEAKEFVRKKLIGKHIRLTIDGTRPAVGEYDAKEVATVTLSEKSGDKNVGLLLVQEGWASVVRHKRDDPDRAPNYDELLQAQEVAKEKKKGMWSGKPSAAKQYMNASESVQKAKMQLGTLQRQKKIPAIVDFVKGASRFTILIPREGISISFVLGGIRAPKSARNPNEKSEPFGQEAHELATRRCNQRDVEIDVHTIDKVGGFIGELYVARESFAKILVEEGYATVHEYSAQQHGNATELLGAQQRAKEARKGLWVDWDPSQDAEEEEYAEEHTNGTNGNAPSAEARKDYRDVVVTNVDDTGKLKIQIIGTGTAALEQMMSAFKTFHMNSLNKQNLPSDPKAGDFVAAQFSEDGHWYRARIRSNDRAAKVAEIVYIDYGNSEKMPWSKLRPLTQSQFSPQKLKGQATDAVLSLLQLPTGRDYLSDAICRITEMTANVELVANVDHIEKDGTLHVTLYDPKNDPKLSESVNMELVGEGLAMVPKKLKAWEGAYEEVLGLLRAKQEEAKTGHVGMWEYGDPTED